MEEVWAEVVCMEGVWVEEVCMEEVEEGMEVEVEAMEDDVNDQKRFLSFLLGS